MNERVVFKQSYKSKNAPSTRALNLKHLQYIATRPGVMKNPGCGFGCFGKIADMPAVAHINDLRVARQEVGEASKSHTIYRAILSVNKETAQEYNLYKREEWERLLRSNISVIQNEMHIKKADFRWLASVHYKKNHPHVHIMYWDAGNNPRQEFIQKERFEEMAEHIRLSFTAKIINSEEIRDLHKEKDATVRETRKQLAAMLREANVADVLNLDHIKPEQCSALGKELLELAAQLPARGSLKYDYLPAKYKAKLDAYLEHVLQISDFSKLNKAYEKINAEVSMLYGNTPKLAESYQEQAHREFIKELGNETLKYLKTVAEDLKAQAPPQDIQELKAITQNIVRSIMKDSGHYATLRSMMPPHWTPLNELLKDERFRHELNALVKELTGDLRVRAKIDGFCEKEGVNQDIKKDIARAAAQAVRTEVLEKLEVDAGYRDQADAESAISCLLSLFRALSMHKNQMQNQRDLRMEHYRNLSETASRDLCKRREQEGVWDLET